MAGLRAFLPVFSASLAAWMTDLPLPGSWRRPANTVIVVDHGMRVAAGSDRVIDIGHGTADEDSRVVASGPQTKVARAKASRTAAHLVEFMG